MGIVPNKEKIRNVLEKSLVNPNMKETDSIEYKYNSNIIIDDEENMNSNEIQGQETENNDFFRISLDTESITNSLLNVKNTKKYPYKAIGIITVSFPEKKEEILNYTCFLIGQNIVLTLASNLCNKNLGGKATSITTSFSPKKVEWENIYIQNENKENKENKENSNLAIIFYKENISEEWIGVQEHTSGRHIYTVFSFKKSEEEEGDTCEEGNINNDCDENENLFRQVFINDKTNPFLDAYKDGTSKEKELIKQSPGSPLYYKDLKNGVYAIGIINENYEYQYFDKKIIEFLIDIIYYGHIQKNNSFKGIDKKNNDKLELIIDLNLSKKDLAPIDIKYLVEFNLKNLKSLDLSSNLIKAQGAFYLSKAKFYSLESLNLNDNLIGDEGLKHICNNEVCFNKLNCLYLFHDNITSYGISYLTRAVFVNNLIAILLSENPKIGDEGVYNMISDNVWNELCILSLNNTGLTDKALEYLKEPKMMKLKRLNIEGNKFTDNGIKIIYNLRMKKIHISYKKQKKKKKKI